MIKVQNYLTETISDPPKYFISILGGNCGPIESFKCKRVKELRGLERHTIVVVNCMTSEHNRFFGSMSSLHYEFEHRTI